MKNILIIAGIVLCSVAFSNDLCADALENPLIGQARGTIFQPGTDAHGNSITVKKRITKRLLLDLFGFSNVPSSAAHYFINYNNNTIVLAKDNSTIYGTLFGGVSTTATWPTKHGAAAYGGSVTVMNGALSGTNFEISGSQLAFINGHFVASGTLNAVPTVMSCSFAFKSQFD